MSDTVTAVVPDYDASINFLKRFHPDRRWVLTAISLDKQKIMTRTFAAETAEKCLAWIKLANFDRNVYFSVGEVAKDVDKKADREDISRVWYLHVDIDPRTNEDVELEQKRALALLQNPPGLPLPTVITFSGGGYQAFWALREPFETKNTLELAEEAKLYNLQIEIALGADNVHNIDRIMRLPGTLNRPDALKVKKGRKPALAQMVEWHEDRVYTLAQFTKARAAKVGAAGPGKLAAAPTAKRINEVNDLPATVLGKARMVILYGIDPDDPDRFGTPPDQSKWLWWLVNAMVRSGCDDDTIFGVITDERFAISASVLEKPSAGRPYAEKQIADARAEWDAQRDAGGSAARAEIDELNGRHFVVGNWGGKCRVAEEVYDDFLRRSRLTKQHFDDFRNRYAHRVVQVGAKVGGEPINKPLGDWWLKHPQRRSYERFMFAPGRKVPEDTYNLWQGFGCEARQGDCGLFLQHMRDNVCGGEGPLYDYLLGWMANAVQRPDEPGQTAVLLRGRQGTGKSLFVKMFGSLFGRHYLRISDMKHLVGSFNAHLRDVVVLFADEAFYAGDKKSRGLLKSLVTDETLSIEAKGVDAEMAANCVHLLMASNDEWMVPAEFDDRRFFVLDVGTKNTCDVGYFRAIAQQMDNGGREALLHLLQSYDLSAFEVRDRPKTKALQEQKELSIDPEVEWLLTLLEDGALPGAPPGPGEAGNVAFSNADDGAALYPNARQRVPKLKDRSDRKLAAVLKKWGAGRWKNGSRGWTFPALGEMRAAWAAMYGEREWAGGAAAEWRRPGEGRTDVF